MRPVEKRYLLRVWRDAEGDPDLRVALRDVRDGSLKTFPGLDDLLEFLRAIPGESERAGGTTTVPPEESGEADAEDLSR